MAELTEDRQRTLNASAVSMTAANCLYKQRENQYREMGSINGISGILCFFNMRCVISVLEKGITTSHQTAELIDELTF